MKASAIIIFFLVLALCHTSFSDDQANSTDDKTNEREQDAKYHFWEDKWDGEVIRYLEEQGKETLGDSAGIQVLGIYHISHLYPRGKVSQTKNTSEATPTDQTESTQPQA